MLINLAMLCAAMFIYDSPYGLLNEQWDHQITVEEVVTIVGQFVVSQATFNHPCVAVVYHKPRDTDIIMTALEQHKYQQFQHLFWYKGRDHATPTPVRSYTNSVEMLTLGFFPDARTPYCDMNTDPRKRHNYINTPPPADMVKNTDGKYVNPTQKPRAILRKLVKNHVRPGDTVLVVGAGAGGDVLGCLDADVNVVAVESDKLQYEYLRATLESENLRVGEEYSAEEEEEDEEEVPSTQQLEEGSKAVPSQSSSSSSSGDGPPKLKCTECGLNEAPPDPDRRECALCQFPGPLCENCSVKDPNGEGWLCTACYDAANEDTQQQ